MGLYMILLVIFLQMYGIFGVTIQRQVYFNETAELSCPFENTQKLTLNELILFWQDQHKLVLFDLYQGQEKPGSVNDKYKDRTSFDRDSWILKLHNVLIQDDGLYACYMHQKKPERMIPINHQTTELSVYANFSQPVITSSSNGTEQSVSLTCSSTNGYPEPTSMRFLIEQGNVSRYHDVDMNKSQNHVTKLYTVSISASFSRYVEEGNMSIFCVLKNKYAELRSAAYKIDVNEHPLPQTTQEFSYWIVAICVTLAFVFLMVLLILKKNKKPGLSYECESVQVEAEEREQPEERVRSHVPERSDEAQCVLSVSKTTSEDKSATDT